MARNLQLPPMETSSNGEGTMRYTATALVPTRLDDTFYCRSRRCGVTLEKCLDGFLEANAMERLRSACFRCPLGRCNRETYADGGD